RRPHPARVAEVAGAVRPGPPDEAGRRDPLQHPPRWRHRRHGPARQRRSHRDPHAGQHGAVRTEPTGGHAAREEGARADPGRYASRGPEYPGLWAAGDCAAIRDAGTGEFCPPTAQHATRQAATVAHNIAASLRGTPQKAFAFTALGKMGSLGRRSAVAEIFGGKVSGFLAWGLWGWIHMIEL